MAGQRLGQMGLLFAISQLWLWYALNAEAWRPLWPRDPNETGVEHAEAD